MKWDGLDNCLWSLMHISGMLYLNRMVGSIGTENGDAADVDHHLVLRDQHSVGGAVHHLQRGLRPRLPLPNVPRLRQPAGNEQLCAQLHHLLLLQQRVPQDAARGVSVLRPQTKAPQHIQLLQHAQHPRHLGRQRSQLRPYHQHIANQRANLQWTDRIPNTWPKTPENYYRNTSRSTFRVHFTDFYESSRGGGEGIAQIFLYCARNETVVRCRFGCVALVNWTDQISQGQTPSLGQMKTSIALSLSLISFSHFAMRVNESQRTRLWQRKKKNDTLNGIEKFANYSFWKPRACDIALQVLEWIGSQVIQFYLLS